MVERGIVVIRDRRKAAVRRRCELLRLVAVEERESGFQGVIPDRFRNGGIDSVAVIGAVVEQETVKQIADAEAVGIDKDGRSVRRTEARG